MASKIASKFYFWKILHLILYISLNLLIIAKKQSFSYLLKFVFIYKRFICLSSIIYIRQPRSLRFPWNIFWRPSSPTLIRSDSRKEEEKKQQVPSKQEKNKNNFKPKKFKIDGRPRQFSSKTRFLNFPISIENKKSSLPY